MDWISTRYWPILVYSGFISTVKSGNHPATLQCVFPGAVDRGQAGSSIELLLPDPEEKLVPLHPVLPAGA